jgi:hypothetical protein
MPRVKRLMSSSQKRVAECGRDVNVVEMHVWKGGAA